MLIRVLRAAAPTWKFPSHQIFFVVGNLESIVKRDFYLYIKLTKLDAQQTNEGQTLH